MWPYFSDIKDVPFVLQSIFFRHHLYFEIPNSFLSFGNRVEQISLRIVCIRTSQLVSLLSSEVLDALFGLEMPFHKEPFIVLVHPYKSMAAVTVHMSVAIRCSSVTEQNSHLMGTFWVLAQIVPNHVGIFQVGLWVSFLGMDEVWELLRISDEKDRGIVASHIPVAFFSIELDSKASWISFSICRSFFTAHS